MKYAVKKEFTDEELIQRVTDVMEIRNVMGRHAYYHAKGLHEKELKEIWVQKPENQKTASFGQNWGYNVGMERIDAYYGKGSVENYQKDLEALHAADPSVEVNQENLGIGSLVIHMLTAPYIEVAADGKTAQGLWYSPGAVGGVHPDHSDGLMMYEKYGVDFMKEDGEWKIWHVLVSNDVTYEAGTNLGDVETFTGKPGLAQQQFGDPTMPYVVHNPDYGWSDAYPTVPPVAYETYDPEKSFGAEGRPQWHKGHPNYRKEYQGK